ncbi:MAG: hypothetical protein KDD89_04835, partial [Anaerolineales bacterium]|nr:hypothetical protein [Anaerolineales bacterium]
RNFSRTISFEYLQSAVPSGRTYEHTLRVYYSPDEGATWTALATELNTTRNLATAVVPSAGEGEGLYVLAATLQMPALETGWNQLAYPVPFTRTLPLAVDSLGDKYTSIYQQNGETWLLYDRTVPAEYDTAVNSLRYLEFGYSYWVYATEPVTPYLGLPSSDAPRVPSGGNAPVGASTSLAATPHRGLPATYYGPVLTNATAGDLLEARIGGEVCGTAVVQTQGEDLIYVLQVVADDGMNGCGVTGRVVALTLHGRGVGSVVWNNSQANLQPLPAETTQNIYYLPLVTHPQTQATASTPPLAVAPDRLVSSEEIPHRKKFFLHRNPSNSYEEFDQFLIGIFAPLFRTYAQDAKHQLVVLR